MKNLLVTFLTLFALFCNTACNLHFFSRKQYQRENKNLEDADNMTFFESQVASNPSLGVQYFNALNNPNCTFNSFPIQTTQPWKYIGIDDQPVNTPSAYNQAPYNTIEMGGTGQVTYLDIDPQNNNHVFTCNASSGATGLWQSFNAGAKWQNAGTDLLEPEIGVTKIAIDPTNSNRWYIAQNEIRIFYTNDGGQTYHLFFEWWSTFGINLSFEKIIINPTNPNIMFIATSKGLWKTNNALSTNPTVTLVNTPGVANTPFFDVCFSQGNPNTIIACSDAVSGQSQDAQLLFSNDGGGTWSNLPNTNDTRSTALRFSVTTTSANPNLLYILVRKDPDTDPNNDLTSNGDEINVRFIVYNLLNNTLINKGWVYQSSSNKPTGSYATDARGVDPARMHSLAVSPLNQDICILGDVKLARCNNATDATIDGGTGKPFIANWTPVNIGGNTGGTMVVHDDIAHNLFSPNSHTVYSATDGGVFKSTDDGVTWLPSNKGLCNPNIFKFDISQTDKNVYSFGNFHCGTTIKQNGVWKHISIGDGQATRISHGSNDQILATAQNGTIRTVTNGGNTYFDYVTSQSWDSDLILNNSNTNSYFTYSQNGAYYNVIRVDNCWSNTPTPIHNIISNFASNGVSANKYVNKLYTSSNNVNLLSVVINDAPYSKLFYTNDANNFSNTAIQSSWVQIPTSNVCSSIYPITDLFTEDENNVHKFWITVWQNNPNGIVFYWNGTSFINLTLNLPDCILPMAIIKQKNTNSLYIGSKTHGVWYLDDYTNSASQWKILNSNLPNTEVVDLQILECGNTLRAGLSGRGLWECPLVKATPNIITTNTTWSSPTKENRDIIIESGVTLTITNLLEMAADAQIIVKRGGKLNVNGVNAKITNNCGYQWQGIQVWGTQNAQQNTTNTALFGKVIVQNGGTIENAKTGIITAQISAAGVINYAYSGGIIQCNNANFINCETGVKFTTYKNFDISNNELNTLSTFTKTKFETNTNYKYNDWNNPSNFAYIEKCSGISFNGCTFENSNPVQTNLNILGNGIYSYNSTLFIGPETYVGAPNGCKVPSGVSTTFTGLNKGINSLGAQGARNINVDNCIFNDVVNGILVATSSNPRITRNTFTFSSAITTSYANKKGIELVSCPLFKIEQNAITGTYPTPTNYKQYGVIIVNAGAANNVIYKNSFTNLSLAFEAIGNNRSIENSLGLTFTCNNYSNNGNDNYVAACPTPDYTCVGNLGINPSQGFIVNSNTFVSPKNNFLVNAPNCTLHSNLKNECSYIKYTNLAFTSSFNILCYTPQTVYIAQTENPVGTCPSSLCSAVYATNSSSNSSILSMNKTELQNQLNISNADYLLIKQLLAATQDGGNTSAVINEILNTQTTEAAELVQSLLAKSPNLSDDVLYEVAKSDDKLTPILQMIVLAANPQAARNLDLLNFLATKQSPMPQIMIDYIEAQNTEDLSLREKIQSQLSDKINAMSLVNNDFVTYFEKDTTGVNIDSLIYYMKQFQSPTASYPIINALIDNSKINEAQEFYSSIPNKYRLSEYEKAEYSKYEQIMNIYINLKQNDLDIADLTTEQISILTEQSLLDNDFATASAKSILDYLQIKPFEFVEKYPEDDSKSRKATKPAKHKPTLEEIISLYGKPQNGIGLVPFTAYPNPAKESISFTYDFTTNLQDGKIVISTEIGNEVATYNMPKNKNKLDVNLTSLASGIYLYKVTCDGKTIKNDKFVIVK